MLLSVSRRTDIPAWYADWFFRRLAQGFVLVPSPRAPHQLHHIPLNPDVVDGIVFWTKNPLPMLPRLNELERYLTVFQFTLTGYGPEAEPSLPDKDTVLIPAFGQLSRKLGPRRVIWRYDPIFFTREYSENWHLTRFEQIARRLQGYTETCVISFLDEYRGTRARMRPLVPAAFDPQIAARLARGIAEIAASCGIRVQSCAEALDLRAAGIAHGSCVDGALFESLLGQPLHWAPAKGQRPECGCAASVDIGIYNTCPGGCRYCYANFSPGQIAANHAAHDPCSPLLVGWPGPQDRILHPTFSSLRVDQLRMDGF